MALDPRRAYKVDLSGKRARRRYPSRDLPTIFSGEASSLHSSEYGIFFGASSLGDDETTEEGSASSTTDDHSIETGTRSDSYDTTEESSRDTTYGTNPSASSDDYTSGSPWASGTGSSENDQDYDDRTLSEPYDTSHYTSYSTSAADTESLDFNDNGSTVVDTMNENDELDSVLNTILSEVPPSLTRSETGTLEENPIVIQIEAPGNVRRRSCSVSGAQNLLSFEDNIDKYAAGITHVKTIVRDEPKSPSGSIRLKHVNYGPGLEIASTSRDVSTIKFLTKNDTLDAFHQHVPKVLACLVNDSLRDDVSSIDNRSLKDRMKSNNNHKPNKSRPRVTMTTAVVDEELGLECSSNYTLRLMSASQSKELCCQFWVCGGQSEMELCFFALITISLFTLTILIAILVAQN
ncbi:hypothetical protein MPSEU_000484900 [Mayamaea pseudoterrestris]|nr:hypothetical protein MPSEU_000484900 [Mayamaea pseudoterrestris]